MKCFLSQFEGFRFTTARRRTELFEEDRTTRAPSDRTLFSPEHRFRDSHLAEGKELTPEEIKQRYKENADFVYEGDSGFYGTGAINPANGKPVNYFLDVTGESTFDIWMTGDGDDVVYNQGGGYIATEGGDDIVYFSEGFSEGFGEALEKDIVIKQKAYLGDGDDKVFGGKGAQFANGGSGDDCFDLGDGDDMAYGHLGSDEFVINLQNTGTDVILDFVDPGDKITVKNGNELAQAGDWILTIADNFEGPDFYNGKYNKSLAKKQSFYEIRNAGNEVAAIFGIGSRQSFIGASPQQYSLTASLDSAGIEILASEQLGKSANLGKVMGSIDFI